jgi:serine/threonine-protein kinase
MTLAPEALLGRVVGGFTLERLIGRGGFAWVFAARRADAAPAAVKILKPRYAGDRTVETRFRQEALTAAQLRHPNIVRILDVGRADGLTYFAMDLYPDSLASRLAREGPLAEPDLVRLGLDIASGLEFAHGKGVVHRDINVHNILLGPNGEAVITDFGIAGAVSTFTRPSGTHGTVGTPQYMSPEHAQGERLDGRSDLYSLGVTLYKAATGEVPFRSTDWFELARMHVEERPEKPRKRRPDLSARLERVILRCLAKDPPDRYQSAAALCEDLLQLGARDRITASFGRTTAGPALTSRVTRGERLRFLLPLLAVVVVALIAALVVWVGR